MLALLLTICAAVAATVLAAEAKAWLPYLSREILDRALAKFPEGLPEETRARWTEEIEADFRGLDDRPLTAFAFAVGVRRKGVRRLAAELALRETISPPEKKRWIKRRTDAELEKIAAQPVYWGASPRFGQPGGSRITPQGGAALQLLWRQYRRERRRRRDS